jgi:vancomycin resistance protein YoaR
VDFLQVVESFDTPLTSDRIRTRNLIRGGEMLTGTVLLPGEEFNLWDTLSPISVENGYYSSGVLVNGIHTEGVGGGLSQMATTSYNAAYFAGYEILQFRPHSVWFERYPAGRESTIFRGSINVRFRNDTPYAAILSSYVENNRVHVDIWSTPHYKVETSSSGKRDIVQAGSREVSGPDCEESGTGQDGFTITNTRTVYFLDGTVAKPADPFTWTYRPDHAVICVG